MWFLGWFLAGALGALLLFALHTNDGHSRLARWWAGTPRDPNRYPSSEPSAKAGGE